MSIVLFDARRFLVEPSYPSIGLRLLSSSRVNPTWSKDPFIHRRRLDVWNERRKMLRRTDPDWQMKTNHHRIGYCHRQAAEDPDWVDNQHRRFREYHAQRYAEDQTMRLMKRLSFWVRSISWVREKLPWGSHRPVLHSAPVKHCCEYCGLTRPGGMLLYWRNIARPASYSCHACYVKRPEGCMPKGYENVTSFKELVARKNQLDKLDSEHTAIEPSAGKD